MLLKMLRMLLRNKLMLPPRLKLTLKTLKKKPTLVLIRPLLPPLSPTPLKLKLILKRLPPMLPRLKQIMPKPKLIPITRKLKMLQFMPKPRKKLPKHT